MHWLDQSWRWGMGFGWIFMILFWVVIILFIAYIAKVLIGRERKELHPETPLDIVRKRYARGEITREEFIQMKKDLE